MGDDYDVMDGMLHLDEHGIQHRQNLCYVIFLLCRQYILEGNTFSSTHLICLLTGSKF